MVLELARRRLIALWKAPARTARTGVGARLCGFALVWLSIFAAAPAARAKTFVFSTGGGIFAGGQPVDIQATFLLSDGQLQITVQNLESDPVSVVQALSSMTFQLGAAELSNIVIAASARTLNVNGKAAGQYTESPNPIDILAVQNGDEKPPWSAVASDGPTTFKFCDPDCGGAFGPPYLLLGGPNSNNAYASAGGSIAGNGPHDPFLDQTMTFLITATGLSNANTIQNVRFGFGTGSGAFINSESPAVPEPSTATLLLFGLGLAGLGCYSRRATRP